MQEAESVKTLLVRIQLLLESHVTRFEDHVKLDDKREQEAREKQNQIAIELREFRALQLKASDLQARSLWVLLALVTGLQLMMKFVWK